MSNLFRYISFACLRSFVYRQPGQAAVVDKKITSEEDDNLKKCHEASRSQPSGDGSELPLRPGYGNKGTPVTLLTNYVEMSMADARQLFTYEAAMDERLHNKRQRHHFMETAMKCVPELSALDSGVATDYASLVVTSAKLALGSGETKTFTLKYYDTELADGRVFAKERPFKLTLSLVGSLSSSNLSRYSMSSHRANPQSIDSDQVEMKAVQTLNVVMASHPNRDPAVYQCGQNKFFRYPTDQNIFENYDLLGGLIAVRGYYSSVRFSTSRTLLNLNAQCSPFYKSINARELVQLFQKLVPSNWLALEQFLERLRVKTSYLKTQDGTLVSKIKTVVGLSHKMVRHDGREKPSGNADVDHGNAINIKFKRIGDPLGTSISVQEYFHTGKFPTMTLGGGWGY